MKILLNLLAANQGGQVTRAREFLKKFKSHAHKNDSLIVLISDKLPFKIKNVRSIKYIKVNFLHKKFYWFTRFIWENTKQIYLIKYLKPDIFLTFSHSLPLFRLSVPTIVGLSNLAPFSNLAFIKDSMMGKIRLLLLKYMIKISTSKATAVIALSNYGKKILVKNNIKKNKLYKISIGVKKQKKIIIDKLNYFKQKYILYVSHFYRYKNFEQLILAYSNLPKLTRLNYRLKLVGNFSDKKYQINLKRLSKKLEVDSSIDFIPGVKEKNLNTLYKNASLFVFPSRIENCPNILLEAMSFSLPVLVAKTEPMPEFSGNVAKYFKLDDQIDLSKKIDSLLSSKKLLNGMSKMSYLKSNQYSWDSFTKKVIDLSRKILLKKYKL
jgi:glycosyltransferase involved in cell wall biosynthesis